MVHTGNRKRHIMMEKMHLIMAEKGFGSLCRLSSHQILGESFITVSCFCQSWEGQNLKAPAHFLAVPFLLYWPLIWGFDRMLTGTQMHSMIKMKFQLQQTMLVPVWWATSILTVNVTRNQYLNFFFAKNQKHKLEKSFRKSKLTNTISLNTITQSITKIKTQHNLHTVARKLYFVYLFGDPQ